MKWHIKGTVRPKVKTCYHLLPLADKKSAAVCEIANISGALQQNSILLNKWRSQGHVSKQSDLKNDVHNFYNQFGIPGLCETILFYLDCCNTVMLWRPTDICGLSTGMGVSVNRWDSSFWGNAVVFNLRCSDTMTKNGFSFWKIWQRIKKRKLVSFSTTFLKTFFFFFFTNNNNSNNNNNSSLC